MKNPSTARFTFEQEADSCAQDGYSFLEVIIEDGGGGPYLVIKTDRWAFDDDGIQEFSDKLRWCLSVCEPKAGAE